VGDNQASLPLSDFDDASAGSLGARVVSLDLQQVEQLIGYERNHAHRAQVLEVLTRRRRQLCDSSEPATHRLRTKVLGDSERGGLHGSV
jgi:hypothetical protein